MSLALRSRPLLECLELAIRDVINASALRSRIHRVRRHDARGLRRRRRSGRGMRRPSSDILRWVASPAFIMKPPRNPAPRTSPAPSVMCLATKGGNRLELRRCGGRAYVGFRSTCASQVTSGFSQVAGGHTTPAASEALRCGDSGGRRREHHTDPRRRAANCGAAPTRMGRPRRSRANIDALPVIAPGIADMPMPTRDIGLDGDGGRRPALANATLYPPPDFNQGRTRSATSGQPPCLPGEEEPRTFPLWRPVSATFYRAHTA
jgi:hypothetical protein